MNPDRLYFTSDHHFGHKSIVKNQNRLFLNTDDMDWFMIQKWNAKIPRNSTVFHLGDFSLHTNKNTLKILEQLNGSIHLIMGNHDRYNRMVKNKFNWIKDYYYLRVDDPAGRQKIVLSHYPFRSWRSSEHGSWNLFGHCHGNMSIDIGKSIDIGVDCHNYNPLSYWEIKDIMSNKKVAVIDHHKEIK